MEKTHSLKVLVLLPAAIIVSLALSSSGANAGISIGQGGITLPAGQSFETCDVWIYATQEGGTYHVETTGEIKPLTSSVTPNDFSLTPIECPDDTNARRACITEKCLSSDQSSCKVVCIKFAAPMIFGRSGDRVAYQGSILNSIKIGAATIKEPYAFSVYVEPVDVVPVAAGVLLIAVVAAAGLIAVRRKSRKK
jgi:general stress protein CsbA